MKKYIILILFILLGGCYNYQELNELAIINAIGIDKIEDEYIISLQVVNTEKIDLSNGEEEKFVVYKGKGKTIQEALNDIATSISKNIYLNSIQVLIINEDISKEGIHSILDLFFRKPNINKHFFVLLSKNTTSENILKNISLNSNSTAKKIKETLKIDSEYYGISQIITFEDLVNMYLNPNTEIILPSVYIESDSVKLGPIGIFKDDKLINYLSVDDSLSYNLIQNKINNTYLTINCEDNNMTIELSNIKSKKELSNNEINIYIKSNGNITESSCEYNLENQNDINKISKLTEDVINTNINNLITDIKKYKTDILGIKDIYYKYNNKYYKAIKNNYYDIFKDIKINVETKINIISKGNILKEIKNG